MRLGQTSVIFFLSRFLASIIGFVATLYIARVVGPDPLGIYHLVIGLVSWLAIVGKIGVSGALTKRVSEGTAKEEFSIAAISVIAILFVVLSSLLLVFRPHVDSYIGYPATGYVVLILLVVLLNAVIMSILTGLHMVHIRGILSTVRISGRSLFQVFLIFSGLSTVGLLAGHVAGYFLVLLIGSYLVVSNLGGISRPSTDHFRSLFDFAKYSWLGSLRGRMFNYTDVIVLGFFVSQTLIGIYAVAWNIGQFLILFSNSLRATLFPEISELSAKQDTQAVSRILEQALTFGGLFLAPGLLGGAILGERILRLYGPEFPQGATVLAILIVANLIQGYQTQFLNTLNGIDRPDLAFRVNAVFVVANLILNVVLIYLYGWVGAAVATATSVGISLVLGYYHVDAIIDFQVPYWEIGKQWFAAFVMAGFVYSGLWVENTFRLLGDNFATVLILVPIGAGVYFVVLLVVSREFRETVDRNLPVDLPYISQ
ncbi:flippase [Halodesulfurarchaeum sp. HSR-GB]|uniref:flippase n=1 Tax=Halodesulfurarchaeum sp. HSR-GB TaxID=3074077 RepID=UPI00285EA59D|nr:flippase [Halodesulfurarchaeum sp. HSR-GB]MDR5657386.1 flippase [Halodesulfurarchaeum sp. HSR-GB]